MVKKEEKYETTFRTKGEGTYSLIEQLEQICAREKWKLNLGIRKAIEEYVVRHGAGNNSFQLDTFGVTWTKAVSTSKCCFKDCGKLAVGVGFFVPKNQTVGLCGLHFRTVSEQPSGMWRDLKCSPRNILENKPSQQERFF